VSRAAFTDETRKGGRRRLLATFTEITPVQGRGPCNQEDCRHIWGPTTWNGAGIVEHEVVWASITTRQMGLVLLGVAWRTQRRPEKRESMDAKEDRRHRETRHRRFGVCATLCRSSSGARRRQILRRRQGTPREQDRRPRIAYAGAVRTAEYPEKRVLPP